jgi:hypothetical protein
MAESYEAADDFNLITFNTRKGVKFMVQASEA